MLLHVIDAADGDPAERFRAIDRELGRYGAGLDERPQAVVLNKIDLLAQPAVFELEDRIVAVLPVSSVTGEGIDELKRALFRLCPPQADPELDEGLPEFLEYRPRPERRRFRVLRTDRGFRVAGEAPTGEELEERCARPVCVAAPRSRSATRCSCGSDRRPRRRVRPAAPRPPRPRA